MYDAHLVVHKRCNLTVEIEREALCVCLRADLINETSLLDSSADSCAQECLHELPVKVIEVVEGVFQAGAWPT